MNDFKKRSDECENEFPEIKKLYDNQLGWDIKLSLL